MQGHGEFRGRRRPGRISSGPYLPYGTFRVRGPTYVRRAPIRLRCMHQLWVLDLFRLRSAPPSRIARLPLPRARRLGAAEGERPTEGTLSLSLRGTGLSARLAELPIGGKGEAVSTKSVAKQTPLKCLDCGREFDGLAVHKEHYVESGTVLVTSVFDRALEDCPACGSHRVDAQDAGP